MAQPTPYDRQYNFQNYQASSPSDPLPGNEVDAEYNALKQTLDQILDNLRVLQRDDTALANDSVGLDQLKPEVQVGINPPTAWVTAHSYIARDTVFQGGGFYFCEVSHISGVFATDLGAGKWSQIADFTAELSGLASDISVVPAGNITTTNVQAALQELDTKKQNLDADLTALAALSSTAGMLARTGAGAFAVRTVVAGNGLTGSNLDGAAGAPSLAVGAGTGILSNADDVAIDKASNANIYAAVSNKVITADLIEGASAEVTLTDGASPTFDWDAGINRLWTVAASRTLPNATNGQPGTYRTIRVIGSSTGPYTLTFGTQYEGDLPTLTDITSTQQYLLTIRCITTSHFLVSSQNATVS